MSVGVLDGDGEAFHRLLARGQHVVLEQGASSLSAVSSSVIGLRQYKQFKSAAEEIATFGYQVDWSNLT